MTASLICFQQFAGGFVGVWGFLVFLRMAVAERSLRSEV